MSFLAKTGVLFENFLGISGFDIYWYGVLIAFGFLLAFINTSFLCKKRGYPSDLTVDMLIICIIGAIVGARTYYVIFQWKSYFVPGDIIATIGKIIDIRQGGLAIYGGIIGCVIGLSFYAWRKKYNWFSLLDVCAGSLALGQAIGRWGNFFNQEAHGALVENTSLQFFPYAVYLDSPKGTEPAGWYQATFFYESLWCFLIFAVLCLLFFKQKYYGQITLTYLALYGFERGIVEWLRTDQLTIGSVPVSAILSIVLCISATITLLILAIKKYKQEIPFYND
ncbi:MAG: prolipoprotein diacylglyceryl transferase [Clostridiales bacterium]|nr:prolipoprotein diacylglyceryl transferase [Clostridiales bacterium]